MLNLRNWAICAVLTTSVLAVSGDRCRAADAKEQALIAVLQSNSPKQDKAIACKKLAVCGSKEAVPALAPLLADEELASWARIPLEVIPGPEADESLRDAVGKLQGKLLVGVINSIGVRRDAKAVDVLSARLKSYEGPVVEAAAVALGRIGDTTAAKALEQRWDGEAAARPILAQGCILCAENLLASGRASESVLLYDKVRNAQLPKHLVLAATRGAIMARGAGGIALLVEQLKSPDKARFAMGLSTARELPGRQVTEALLAELAAATPERQALLVLALADRDDPSRLPALLKAAQGGAKNVRIAAIHALQRQGDASCLPVLLDVAVDNDAELSQAAIAALADLPGKTVDADLTARLTAASGRWTQLALIKVAGERQIVAAVSALMGYADDRDVQIRCAALAALGRTVGPAELPVLVGRVVLVKDTAETKAAEQALRAASVRMPDREACAELLAAAVANAPLPAKCTLVKTIGAVGGTKALAAIGTAAKDANPELQDLASQLLGGWMTADAAPVLLDLAKTPDAKFKVRALRGYLRIARQLKLPMDQQIAMCREAIPLAQRDDEKKLVLQILGRNPSPAALAMAVRYLSSPSEQERGTAPPFLSPPGVQEAASLAALRIGEKIVATNRDAVKTAMQQVLQVAKNKDIASRAKALLDTASKPAGK
jgi:HEAT repeat protein